MLYFKKEYVILKFVTSINKNSNSKLNYNTALYRKIYKIIMFYNILKQMKFKMLIKMLEYFIFLVLSK